MKITNRQFSWSDDTTASRYNKDWTNYLTLAVHLLMILINHSKERLPLEYVRTTLPLKTLIDTIEYYFTVSCSRDGDLRDK